LSPEDVVAVAEVRVAATVGEVEEPGEELVSAPAQVSDVVTAPVAREPGSLGEIRSCGESRHEPWYLSGIRRPVGIHHRDDVPGGGLETTGEGVPLARPVLRDHGHVRPDGARGLHCAVLRAAVDQYHLMYIGRNLPEDVWDILFFIECRDDNRN